VKAGRALITLALLAAGAVQAQPVPVPPFASKPDLARADYDLKPRQIAPGTWVIEGEVADFSRANGCNIINTAFIDTGDGLVVINTGPSRLYGEQQRRAIERITKAPVRKVLQLNLHPDYFFGHQAWDDRPTEALAGTIAGARAEGGAYADNLYRLCGDWMRGTESTPSREAIDPKALPQTRWSSCWPVARPEPWCPATARCTTGWPVCGRRATGCSGSPRSCSPPPSVAWTWARCCARRCPSASRSGPRSLRNCSAR